MDDKCVNDGHIFPPIRLFLTGCLVVLGGSFHFGFEMSIVNPAADILQQFIRQSFRNHYNEQELSEMAMRFIWPTIAGLFLFGATFGALAMPKIVDNYGRKIGLTISSIILVLALPMVAMSQLFMAFEMFVVGRLLAGIGIGMATCCQGVYLTEISPIRFRGQIGMLMGCATASGFFLGTVAGLPQLLGTARLWPIAFYLEAIPSFVLLCLLPLFRESPAYLLKENRETEARASIRYYFGAKYSSNIDEIVNQLLTETNESTLCKNESIVQTYRNRANRMALLLAIALNCTVSFSGIMAFSFFGTFLLNAIGFDRESAAIANSGCSTIGVMSVFISSSLFVERFGRRRLLLISLLGLAAVNLSMMILLLLFAQFGIGLFGYAFIVLSALMLLLFDCGLGPMAWFIGSELSPIASRSRTQSFAISSQYITSFISPILFYPLEALVGPFSFMLFIVPLLATAVFFYRSLPETKNRPIHDIMLDLDKKKVTKKKSSIFPILQHSPDTNVHAQC